MKKTELLALADQCDYFSTDSSADKAAEILRKLAALEPVAWILEYGAVSLPKGHPSRITDMSAHFTLDDAQAEAADCDYDRRIFSVYTLTGVIDHE